MGALALSLVAGLGACGAFTFNPLGEKPNTPGGQVRQVVNRTSNNILATVYTGVKDAYGFPKNIESLKDPGITVRSLSRKYVYVITCGNRGYRVDEFRRGVLSYSGGYKTKPIGKKRNGEEVYCGERDGDKFNRITPIRTDVAFSPQSPGKNKRDYFREAREKIERQAREKHERDELSQRAKFGYQAHIKRVMEHKFPVKGTFDKKGNFYWGEEEGFVVKTRYEFDGKEVSPFWGPGRGWVRICSQDGKRYEIELLNFSLIDDSQTAELADLIEDAGTVRINNQNSNRNSSNLVDCIKKRNFKNSAGLKTVAFYTQNLKELGIDYGRKGTALTAFKVVRDGLEHILKSSFSYEGFSKAILAYTNPKNVRTALSWGLGAYKQELAKRKKDREIGRRARAAAKREAQKIELARKREMQRTVAPKAQRQYRAALEQGAQRAAEGPLLYVPDDGPGPIKKYQLPKAVAPTGRIAKLPTTPLNLGKTLLPSEPLDTLAARAPVRRSFPPPRRKPKPPRLDAPAQPERGIETYGRHLAGSTRFGPKVPPKAGIKIDELAELQKPKAEVRVVQERQDPVRQADPAPDAGQDRKMPDPVTVSFQGLVKATLDERTLSITPIDEKPGRGTWAELCLPNNGGGYQAVSVKIPRSIVYNQKNFTHALEHPSDDGDFEERYCLHVTHKLPDGVLKLIREADVRDSQKSTRDGFFKDEHSSLKVLGLIN